MPNIPNAARELRDVEGQLLEVRTVCDEHVPKSLGKLVLGRQVLICVGSLRIWCNTIQLYDVPHSRRIFLEVRVKPIKSLNLNNYNSVEHLTNYETSMEKDTPDSRGLWTLDQHYCQQFVIGNT